jgi:formylglycine-generating enzyme required for sulfatase activity
VSGGVVGPTGIAGCVSNAAAFDMVGNLWEWVADWNAESTACVAPLFAPTSDRNCLAGASDMGGPGALIRGGGAGSGMDAGVFAVSDLNPSGTLAEVGFRAAR